MTEIIDISELELLDGGDCYTFTIKLNLVVVTIEGVRISVGDCAMS